MQAFFDIARAEPWPFIAAGILLVCLILSQFFGDSSGPDLPGLGD